MSTVGTCKLLCICVGLPERGGKGEVGVSEEVGERERERKTEIVSTVGVSKLLRMCAGLV